MYKIREAKAADYPAINRLNNARENMQLIENNSILEEGFYHESLQDVDSNWFLVEKSGEVKAFIFFTIDRTAKVMEIKKFTINHNDRKKGINDHLYKILEEVAGQSEVESIRVEISDSYLDVIDFFERNSWIKENQGYVKYRK